MIVTEENFHDEADEISAPAAEEKRVALTDEQIRDIAALLENDHIDEVRQACLGLSPPDLADLLAKLDPDNRRKSVDVLDEDIDPETFAYMDEGVRTGILRDMDAARVALIVKELDSDDALRLIEDLDDTKQKEILRSLSRKVRAVVEEGLTFPEESAGRLMQREFVAIPQFWTVGKTLDYLRAAGETLPEDFYDIFVLDPMHKVVGTVRVGQVLRSRRAVKIDDIIHESRAVIPAEMDQEEVAFIFRRDGLISAPVVDENGRLIGVITVDDVVDVIDREAQEDILRLAGVDSSSDIYRAVMGTAQSRFLWLAINLVTAVAASAVIGLFEGTIQQIVALAVLMPIVASMGGNAGTQTLTVAVRALATKELSSANAWRVITKELIVGCINGFLFAVITGVVTWLWFSSPLLGAIIAAAMIVNLIVAGFSGVIIPIGLARIGFDPAVSSAVFLTTVTDVIGFFAFLGLAALFLL